MSNQVKIKLPEVLFQVLCKQSILTQDMLLEVYLDDDFLKDDDMYQKMKKDSLKDYNKRKDYVFNRKHNIKGR
jgi:hypothetical protein